MQRQTKTGILLRVHEGTATRRGIWRQPQGEAERAARPTLQRVRGAHSFSAAEVANLFDRLSAVPSLRMLQTHTLD